MKAKKKHTKKKCCVCKKEMCVSDFYADKRKPDGLRYDCKDCFNKKLLASMIKRVGETNEKKTDRIGHRNGGPRKKS